MHRPGSFIKAFLDAVTSYEYMKTYYTKVEEETPFLLCVHDWSTNKISVIKGGMRIAGCSYTISRKIPESANESILPELPDYDGSGGIDYFA